MRRIAVFATALLLAGCAYQVQMMRRDSGKIYTGTAQGNGFGAADMTVTIDDRTYTGHVVRTSSNSGYGFFQQYQKGANPSFGSYQSVGGSATLTGLLASKDGHGLRCEMTSDNMGHGGGICVDDAQQVYDVLIEQR